MSNFQVYFCILFIFFLHIIYFLFTKKLDATDCEVAEESFFPSGWAFHKKAAFGCSFIHEELPQCRVARLTWQTFYTRCPSWHSSPRDLCTLLFLNQGFFFFYMLGTLSGNFILQVNPALVWQFLTINGTTQYLQKQFKDWGTFQSFILLKFLKNLSQIGIFFFRNKDSRYLCAVKGSCARISWNHII